MSSRSVSLRGARGGTASVLLAAMLWGTTGTAATFAPTAGPFAIGAAAMGVGGLLQAALASGPIARERRALLGQRNVLLLGASAVAVYPLMFYGSMRLVGVAVGTVVSIGSAPIAAALVEMVVDGHRLTPRLSAAATIGLAGMALLSVAQSGSAPPYPSAQSGQPALVGGWSHHQTLIGIGCGLVAGLTYALYSWTAHRLMRGGVSTRPAMGATFGLGGLMLMPVLLVTGSPFVQSGTDAAVAAYMALVPMFVGYTLYGWGLAHVAASTATILTLLEPAVAAALAVAVVGEHISAAGWAGVGLVLAGLTVLASPRKEAR